jgi:DNA topoisomerase-1
MLPALKSGEKLEYKKIDCTERFTQRPARYTEASLVRKMEELGIGRPSTYAPTISTIQQRDYIVRGNRDAEKREYQLLEMNKKFQLSEKTKSESFGLEKAKLFPTDIGIVVNDFLTEHFTNIMDYHFTASIEKQFDEVAEGKMEWHSMMNDFYQAFHPCVDMANTYSKEKVGARILGTDPKSGRPVSVRIGRFGPIAQIGTVEDEEKPLFASLKKNQLMETLSLEEALDLFKLPMTLGEYEGLTVTIGTGRFGPYVLHNGKYVSIPKGIDPFNIDLQQAIELIQEKMSAEQQKHIKKFEEHPDLELLNGRYGAYICYKGTNYRLPKSVNDPKDLTVEQCMDIIKAQDSKPKKAKSRG